MREDGQKKMAGPMPTLFVGAGTCAQGTLAEFSRLTQSLTVSLRGPFGLALLDSQAEGLFVCDWPFAADFRSPEPALIREGCEPMGPDEEKLGACLASLVRRLRSTEPTADPAPGRTRLHAYVVIDLSEAVAVAAAVRLMRVLRRVDPALDTTVLGLTARVASNSAADDNAWFVTWKLLLEQLQDGPWAQRVCLLDGRDADKTWFERPEQLHRLGAEFLFYHGLTCRNLLRQHERARIGSHESLLNVCGSFGCRTITAELSVVAERVAERLAQEDLADLYTKTIPGGWLVSIQEQARSLVDRIAAICERAYQAEASSGRPSDRRETHRAEDAEIAAAIRGTIQHVCSREPLVSLCLFFQLLRPKLARLLSQQRLWERSRVRQMVAEAFRLQDQNTYEPMRTWLAQPQTRWVDRFTPALPEPSHAAVSRPANKRSYLTGWLVLTLGLAEVGMGIFLHSRFVAAAGGLISLAASVLMTLPSGWTRHPRIPLVGNVPVRASAETAGGGAAGATPYRRQAGKWTRLGALALVLTGLACVTWPWWPQAWSLTTGTWAVALVAMAGGGLALVAGAPRRTRPDQVTDEEAPGHAGPPVWWRWAAGLLCLALAWAVFCLGAPPRDVQKGEKVKSEEGRKSPLLAFASACLPYGVPLAGLALVAAGAGWALFPRSGRAHLVERLAKMPQPTAGGIGRPVKERQLPPRVTAMAAWANHLVLEPEQCLEGFRAKDVKPSRETLFDFLAPDWEGQLAQAFRRAVAARSGKSLQVLAQQPVLWAQCILDQLQDSHAGAGIAYRETSRWESRCELTSLFALQAVKAWIESTTLADLLSFLNLDLARFGSLVGRLACVHWPTPRADPDMSVSVVAVGKPVWDALVPLACGEGKKAGSEEGRSGSSSPLPSFSSCSGGPALVLLDWDSDEDRIVVLRAVQGLSRGWRGFPGLPGQFPGSGSPPADRQDREGLPAAPSGVGNPAPSDPWDPRLRTEESPTIPFPT